MKHRSPSSPRNHGNRIPRLRSPLRTNVILRCNSHHQSLLGYSIYRSRSSSMALRGILRQKRYPHTILYISFPPSFRHSRTENAPPPLPTRNGIQQPYRSKLRYRQGTIPRLLLIQGRLRFRPPPICPNNHRPVLPNNSRGPRKFCTRKPISYPCTHTTRVVLPICVRHPPIHTKQARRSHRAVRLHPRTICSPNSPLCKPPNHCLPTTGPNSLLNLNSRHPFPNLNRGATSRRPLHPLRPS